MPQNAYSGLGGGSPPFEPGTFGNLFYGENPQAAFQQQIGQRGLAFGQSPRALYYQRQWPQGYQGFLGQLVNRPNLGIQDYLPELFGQLDQSWNRLSPRQRGENPGAFQAPTRYVGF